MLVRGRHYRTVWMEGGDVLMIDQLQLPHQFEIYRSGDHRETARAIKDMIIRGAPAIGQAAAYGMVQVLMEAPPGKLRGNYIREGHENLKKTRPTARNLFYALDRICRAADGGTVSSQVEIAKAEADRLAEEEIEACKQIGEHGAGLIRDGFRILTHCNAGWLACVDWGTALAPIYHAHREGKSITVIADETRPRCQGANLTAWELLEEGVTCTIAADNAAGLLMQRGEIDMVITGADRIAVNGDTANKIGTYGKALLAHDNGVPFYIAAPLSTFDMDCPDGGSIPIEERSPDEVLYARGLNDDGEISRVRLGPEKAVACNPGFDVTPSRLMTGIITPHGIISPGENAIRHVMKDECATAS
jgi:methylthioribose-1-phosphate isomerase